MLSLDLFNTVYERALNEGAVDDLEARHIHGLSTKMLDLMTRAKNAKPEMKAALMREYAKIKDERDSFFKIKTEGEVTRTATGLKHRSTDAYGGSEDEPDPLARLDKHAVNRADKALGVKFDREKKYQGGLDIDETGIPGNVPAEKIPGKEDLLKGKGRSYYEENAGGQTFIVHFADTDTDETDTATVIAPDLNTARKIFSRENPELYIEMIRPAKTQFARHDFGNEVDEAGIPGNVPADKIPGKEDLLKGKGRSYYEGQAQKKNSDKPLDQALQRLKVKARREHPRAHTDDEALALKILNKEQEDVARLSKENEREERMIARLDSLEQNLQQQLDQLKSGATLDEHGGGIGPKQRWQDLMHEDRLSVGDPVIVTAPNEFEGKTGEISEFSPSGKFVVVDLYNHGQHAMHLSDVTYNEYADEEDDYIDEGSMSELDAMRQDLELMSDPQFLNAYGISKVAFQQKYRTLLKPAVDEDIIDAIADYTKDMYAGKQGAAVVANALGTALGLDEETANEGWSNKMVAQRTGQAPTPYSVYIKGKEWKSFADDDHAENVANKLRAKFKQEGKDPSVITIAPSGLKEGNTEKDLPQWKKDWYANQKPGSWPKHPQPYHNPNWIDELSPEDLHALVGQKDKEVKEVATDYSKRRQRERDVDAGKPVAKQRQSKMTDYQKRRAQQKKEMELGEEEVRLDPKCWKGKKIGNPKTKMKGGVRVNNCVPAESVEEEWSQKYKDSINCSNPKGFSQRAHCAGKKKNENTTAPLAEEQDTTGVERAILNRIMVAHTDLLMKFGPEKVMQAAEEVAYNVGDVDEVGTSDVSAWVHEVKQILGA